MIHPLDDLRRLLGDLPGPETEAAERLRVRLPEGAGALAELAVWLAVWGGGRAAVRRPVLALYAAAAHGGETQPLRDRLEALAAGAAPAARIAGALGAGLDAFDLAVDRPTGDPAAGPVMSAREAAATAAFGMEALAKGPDLLLLAAVGPERDWGALHGALAAGEDGLEALAAHGGRQVAALAGAVLAARVQRTPVVLGCGAARAAAACLSAVRADAAAHALAVGEGGLPTPAGVADGGDALLAAGVLRAAAAVAEQG